MSDLEYWQQLADLADLYLVSFNGKYGAVYRSSPAANDDFKVSRELHKKLVVAILD